MEDKCKVLEVNFTPSYIHALKNEITENDIVKQMTLCIKEEIDKAILKSLSEDALINIHNQIVNELKDRGFTFERIDK